jgi:hypothetical protein
MEDSASISSLNYTASLIPKPVNFYNLNLVNCITSLKFMENSIQNPAKSYRVKDVSASFINGYLELK